MSAETSMSLIMFGAFIFICASAIIVEKYHRAGKTKLNGGQVILMLCLLFFAAAYFFIKSIGSDERQQIINNVTLKTTVTNITFDTHKPYFKDMTLDDGQTLPMPETMNNTLQIGDSIYKNKGEDFYTVVNAKIKSSIKYEVKIHLRELSKPQ